MKRLNIIGAGGHGKVVAEIAQAVGWQDILFYDRAYPQKDSCGRWPVVGDLPEEGPSICAVGRNEIRQKICDNDIAGESPVLCHPSAVVSAYASIGAGSVLMAGAILNADTLIGRGAIINTAASVDHDGVIGDFAHLSPGARLAGGVTVGARTWIGLNASICEGLHIGRDVVIGAGAVILQDVPDGARMVGNPARAI